MKKITNNEGKYSVVFHELDRLKTEHPEISENLNNATVTENDGVLRDFKEICEVLRASESKCTTYSFT